MKGLKPFLHLLLGCLVCAILSGCAGSTPPNGPSALIISQVMLPEGVPGLAYKQLMIAQGGLQPYTWTISAGSLPPGLSLTTDGVLSGTPTTTGTYSFTVQVIDSQQPTKAGDTSPFSITINPPLSLTSTSLQSGLVGGGYSATITASNGVQPYGYVIAFGSLPPGLTLITNPQPMGGGANSATISGTPTAAGVFAFTIQATDLLSEVASASFSITITGRLEGPYAFSFNGYGQTQSGGPKLPVYMVGSFMADGNGNITSGAFDQSGPGPVSFTNVPLMPSTYSLPQGSSIANINLTSTHGTYGLAATLSTTSDSSFIMKNSSIWGSGVLKKQTTMSLSNNSASYAFGLFGNDPAGNRYAGAGMFTTSFPNISGGAEDTNDNGTPSGELSISGGTISNPDGTTGRGTFTLEVNGHTQSYAYYTTAVLTGQLVAVETDELAQTLVTLLPQEGSGITGAFSNTTLACTAPAACSVMQLNGLTSAGPDASVGVATFDGNGNITRTGIDTLPGFFTDENNAGTASQNSYNGTYNVDASCGLITTACGRVTVNLQDAPTQPVWYLVTKNEAFVVGTDPAVTSGQLLPQSGSPFTIASLLGSFLGGTLTPVSNSVTNELDVAGTPPPGGIWAVNYDSNGPDGLMTNQHFIGTYAFDPTYGAKFGRFTVMTNSGQPVGVLYIAGGGAAGATGGKAGLFGLNVGKYDGTPDPNPRVSQYGR